MDERTHEALLDLLATKPEAIISINLSLIEPPAVLLREGDFFTRFPDAEPREWEDDSGREILFYEAESGGIKFMWNEEKAYSKRYGSQAND